MGYLMTRYSNQSFWGGASDLEAAGTFRWFYSGDQFSSDLWSSNPISGRHCVRFNENFLKFSAAECGDKNYFICEYTPEIYIPIDDSSPHKSVDHHGSTLRQGHRTQRLVGEG